MKVLFQSRLDLFSNSGGDTVQVTQTADELRKLGVHVDINCELNLDLSSYDLVHIFQLQWICEPYLQAFNAKKYNKPLVLSPIHHSEVDVLAFENLARSNYRRIVNMLISSQEARDIFKNIYRSVFIDRRKLYPTLLSIKDGYRNQQREVIRMSDIVITQTNMEVGFIERDLNIKLTNWKKIVNGVGDIYLKPNLHDFMGMKDYIVTVGRIEARKNQLRIIDAVERLREKHKKDYQLMIVGRVSKNDSEYAFRFKNALKTRPWIKHITFVEYEDMPSLYSNASVCVSASWFETSGLTMLEAAFCGCKIVSCVDVISEYLGTQGVFYGKPDNTVSIEDAIFKALNAEVKPNFTAFERTQYTWAQVAKETLTVYNSLLDKTL